MTNKIYAAQESGISFKSSGGSAVITLTSLANAAGRISAQYDRTTASKAVPHLWRARCRAAVNPVVGVVVRLYIIQGNTTTATTIDGAFATTDAAVASENSLLNCLPIGVIVADAASTTKDFVSSGIVELYDRYVQVAFWNAMGQALSATAGDMEFTLYPVPPEVQ